MKRLFTFILATSISFVILAQSPEKLSYQAIIRDPSDNLMRNQPIGMQVSIIQGNVNGDAVYIETHKPTTNIDGLITLEIGSGTSNQNFADINWLQGPYFIKTETDPKGGNNYTITSVSTLLSVPYALHAKTAENVIGVLDELDPKYTSSQAANITATDITNLSNLTGINTGDQNLSNLATTSSLGDSTSILRQIIIDAAGTIEIETDPVFSGSQAASLTSTDITNLGNLSGTNTGDQDLSNLATKTALGDSTAKAISLIPDVSSFLSSETDPLYSGSQAANITAAHITNLGNLSGTNTGDQDLSILATKTALGDSTAKAISLIPDVSGFLSSETDPLYSGSQAANITAAHITNLGNLSGTNTGDQDLSILATKTALGDSTAKAISLIPDVSGFLSSETDPLYSSSQAANITAAHITNLGNLSGTNTGDQDLSTLATKTALGDSTAKAISLIPDVSGFISVEADPVYLASQAANITSTEITKLSNLSGTNTGDQDLSTLATKTALGDSVLQLRSEIPTGSVIAYSIGDIALGGVVFWVDASGQHGLVASVADQSAGIEWYNGSFVSTGATWDAIYAGTVNSNLTISTQGAGAYAAQLCADFATTLNNEFYDDWYLPSKYELNLLYQQKDVVGGFSTNNYWSSSESDANDAWYQTFGGGDQLTGTKSVLYSVRAIRSF